MRLILSTLFGLSLSSLAFAGTPENFKGFYSATKVHEKCTNKTFDKEGKPIKEYEFDCFGPLELANLFQLEIDEEGSIPTFRFYIEEAKGNPIKKLLMIEKETKDPKDIYQINKEIIDTPDGFIYSRSTVAQRTPVGYRKRLFEVRKDPNGDLYFSLASDEKDLRRVIPRYQTRISYVFKLTPKN